MTSGKPGYRRPEHYRSGCGLVGRIPRFSRVRSRRRPVAPTLREAPVRRIVLVRIGADVFAIGRRCAL